MNIGGVSVTQKKLRNTNTGNLIWLKSMTEYILLERTSHNNQNHEGE